MIALALLAQGIALHSAWLGPGVPPPEYNAAVGDPTPVDAPEQRWACNMRAPSNMGSFEVRISAGKLDRVFVNHLLPSGKADFHMKMTVMANSTLGTVAVEVIDDVENGKPGIGAFIFSLNKATGDATFSSSFSGEQHNPPADGHCTPQKP